MRQRTFTDAQLQARDSEVAEWVADHCRDCISDGDAWTPAETCPVHGPHSDRFWGALNSYLDERYPGRWVDGPPPPATDRYRIDVVALLLFVGVVAIYGGLIALAVCWRAGLL